MLMENDRATKSCEVWCCDLYIIYKQITIDRTILRKI